MLSVAPRSLDREVTSALSVMLASSLLMLSLAAGGLSWLFIASNPHVTREGALVRDVEDLHADLLDEETGLRAYAVTGDPTFLEPYNLAAPQARTLESSLSARVRGGLVGPWGETYLAEERWSRQWADEVLRSGSIATGKLDESKLRALLAQGKTLFDKYRQAEGVLIARARAQLTSTRDEQEDTILVTGIAFALIELFTVALVFGRRRSLRRRVVGSVSRLLGVVHNVADGRLDPAPTVDGPAEIVDLRDGLDLMISSLGQQQRELADRAEEAAEVTRRLRHVLTFARDVAGSLTLHYVLEVAAASACTIMSAPRARVWLIEEGADDLQLAFDTDLDRKAPVPPMSWPVGVGVVGEAAARSQATTSDAVQSATAATVPALAQRVLAQPLVVGVRLVGVLEIVDGDGRAATTAMREILETIASHSATAIEAARLHQHTEHLSLSDPLTGLANRRRLDSDLAVECEHALRHGRPLAFVMLDIDHFKSVNDTLGHTRGDEVLQQVAWALRDEMRTCDTVYRYGGEEFAVLARETDDEGGVSLAERLRSLVEQRFSAPEERPGTTISLGVASLPLHATSPIALAQAADAALYEAKRTGRNRVCVAPSSGAGRGSVARATMP